MSTLSKKLKHGAIFCAFVLGSAVLFHITVDQMQKAGAADGVLPDTVEAADAALSGEAELPAPVTDTLSASAPVRDTVPAEPAPAQPANAAPETPAVRPAVSSILDDEPDTPAEAGVGYADGEELVVTARTSLTLKKSGSVHTPFFHGYDDNTFRPSGKISRAEGCQILYNLLSEVPTERARLSDVPANAWYYDAVASLAAYGVIDVTNAEARPSDPMTRGEFVSALAYFFPGKVGAGETFTDVEIGYPYYGAVQKASALGWVNGYGDGTFQPDGTITRAEAATVMNRALKRTPDEEWIDAHVTDMLYTDLTPEHWAYYTVMEAAIGHTASGDPETWSAVDGYGEDRMVFDGLDFHMEDAKGNILKNTKVGEHLTFGADGHYTSGDADVDVMVKQVLTAATNDSMTREEKLKAAFLYVRDGFFYRRNNFYEVGETGWELEEARTMLTKGKGNCYNYTATFCMIARQLGYDASAISGLVGDDYQQHGWVEIPAEDGSEILIYDTTLESSYVAEDPKWHLAFFALSYNDVPWPYVK